VLLGGGRGNMTIEYIRKDLKKWGARVFIGFVWLRV
jgi:hypothetical protein